MITDNRDLKERLVDKDILRIGKQKEIPCLVLLHPHSEIAGNIQKILNPLGSLLGEMGIKVNFLSENRLTDDNLIDHFEELASTSVLGILILDHINPDLIYQVGYLRGSGKCVLVLCDYEFLQGLEQHRNSDDGTAQNSKRDNGLADRQEFVNR